MQNKMLQKNVASFTLSEHTLPVVSSAPCLLWQQVVCVCVDCRPGVLMSKKAEHTAYCSRVCGKQDGDTAPKLLENAGSIPRSTPPHLRRGDLKRSEESFSESDLCSQRLGSHLAELGKTRQASS